MPRSLIATSCNLNCNQKAKRASCHQLNEQYKTALHAGLSNDTAAVHQQ